MAGGARLATTSLTQVCTQPWQTWSRGLLPVLRVGDVLAPGDGATGVVGLLHRQVGHEAVGGGAVPVLLAGFEEHAVARADDLDGAAEALAEPHALGDVDGLPKRVGVPGGPSAGGEVDARGSQAGGLRGRSDGVDEDGAGEPLARPGSGFGAAASGYLHAVLLGRGFTGQCSRHRREVRRRARSWPPGWRTKARPQRSRPRAPAGRSADWPRPRARRARPWR